MGLLYKRAADHIVLIFSVTYCGYDDEKRLEDLCILGEQIESEVDEDEILRQLGHDSEHIFGGFLSLDRHRMICVMLQCDTAEQQRDDT